VHVHGGGEAQSSGSKRKIEDTARENQSGKATFSISDLQNPFASGAFRWVANGVYVDGSRDGKQAVCKWFKSGSTFEPHFIQG